MTLALPSNSTSSKENMMPLQLLTSTITMTPPFKDYPCTYPNCSKRYKKPCLLIEHHRTHTGESPFQCPICLKCFRRERNLAQHAKVHQETSATDPTLPCSYPGCSEVFRTQRSLRRHQCTHTKTASYSCTEPGCGSAFMNEKELRRHRTLHTGKKLYPCEWDNCELSFNTPSKLKIHMACHTNPKTYSCTSCSLTFCTFLSLYQHQQQYHESRQSILCDRCDRVFFSDTGYQRHTCYVCDQCGKKFTKKSNYETHVWTVHVGRRSFACPECPSSFKTHQHCQRHLQHHHHLNLSPSSPPSMEVPIDLRVAISGFHPDRRFACTMCHRRFSRHYDLKRHVQANHPNAHALTDTEPPSISLVSPEGSEMGDFDQEALL